MTIGILDGLTPAPGGGGGAPAQTYLHQLAIDAGAKHVWLGPDAPLEDLVGAADLSLTSTGDGAPSVPLGVRGLLSRGGTPGGAGPAASGVTIHKNADRSGIYLFRLDAAPSAHMGIMALGAYNSANSGPCITALSPGGGAIVAFRDRDWSQVPKLDLYNYTTNLNKWCVVFWHWDTANTRYNVAWRLEDGTEQTGTLSASVEGTTTTTIYAGAQGGGIMNTVLAPFHRAAFALADGDVLYDAAFRAACYAALGWE